MKCNRIFNMVISIGIILYLSLTGILVNAATECPWCWGSGKSSAISYVTCSNCGGKGCSSCNNGAVLAPPAPCAGCGGTGLVLESFQILYYENDGVTQAHGFYTSEGSTITIESPLSKREGFTFKGWATYQDGPVSYQPGDSVLINESLKLYAIWEEPNDDDIIKDENACANCNGNGYILKYKKCSICNGTNYISTQSDCSNCKGLGIIMKTTARKCTRCYGGSIGVIVPNCYICNGEGWLYTTLGEDCSKCDGKGKIYGSRICQDCDNGSVKYQVICSVCVGSGNTTSVKYKGDINQDNKVTVTDVTLLQKYILGISQFDQTQWIMSDMNGDGEVDVFDLALLKRKLLESR